MRVWITDTEALEAVEPERLTGYARERGWTKAEPYGEVSDAWRGEGLPEVLIPRTNEIGDYAQAVASLLEVFADGAGTDELAVYAELTAPGEEPHDVKWAQGKLRSGERVRRKAWTPHDRHLRCKVYAGTPRIVEHWNGEAEEVDHGRDVKVSKEDMAARDWGLYVRPQDELVEFTVGVRRMDLEVLEGELEKEPGTTMEEMLGVAVEQFVEGLLKRH